MAQADVTERVGISDRTYADIERGNVNMRVGTLQKICNALQITPDNIFTEDQTSLTVQKKEALAKLEHCIESEKRIVWRSLSLYLELKQEEV